MFDNISCVKITFPHKIRHKATSQYTQRNKLLPMKQNACARRFINVRKKHLTQIFKCKFKIYMACFLLKKTCVSCAL